jgi:hypothetical protein
MAIAADKVPAVIEGEFSIVRPLVSADKALANFHEYEALTKALLKEDDFQTFAQARGDKPAGKFIKKSGFRKLATYYGFSIELVDERLGHKHDERICARVRFPDVMKDEKDCGCPITFARYVVKVTAPNGRVVIQPGLCSIGEDRKFTRIDHDVATTAYTRAVSRAIADMIGVGKPSAEEARESGAVVGLSREDKDAITNAWRLANSAQRDGAEKLMRDTWGFKGQSRGQLFTDFNLTATDEQVAGLLIQLSNDEMPFDPDKVPAEPLPTEGGRT